MPAALMSKLNFVDQFNYAVQPVPSPVSRYEGLEPHRVCGLSHCIGTIMIVDKADKGRSRILEL